MYMGTEVSFQTYQIANHLNSSKYFITGYESEDDLQRTTATIAVNFDDTITQVYHALYLQIPSVYSIQNEYLLLEKALHIQFIETCLYG